MPWVRCDPSYRKGLSVSKARTCEERKDYVAISILDEETSGDIHDLMLIANTVDSNSVT